MKKYLLLLVSVLAVFSCNDADVRNAEALASRLMDSQSSRIKFIRAGARNKGECLLHRLTHIG